MRITYYEATDSAVIVLREPGPDTVGEIAGEDLTAPEIPGVVLHRDDAGELYHTEIYSGASKRLALDKLDFERVPAQASAKASAKASAHGCRLIWKA
jgi:hypothetical protein